MRLVEPEQHGERRSDLERPGATDLLTVGWHAPPFVHEDTPALMLLATILGGWHGLTPFAAGDWHSRSNRLYRALVDAKLATEVSVRHELKLDPAGNFNIFVKDGRICVNNGDVTVAGDEPMTIIETLADKGLVSMLDHAGYLGKELEKARLAIRFKRSYLQDDPF